MQFALVLRELWSRRLLVSVGLVIAAVVATLSVARLDGFRLRPRQLQYSAAYTQAFVDTPSSALGNLNENLTLTESRATLYANLMTSPAVLYTIGQIAGIPGNQLYAAGPVDQLQPRSVQEPTAVKRNVELTGETSPYRLSFNNDPNLPDVSIYAQAPTTEQAIKLANASVAGLQQYVARLESQNNVRPSSRVIIRQLGEAYGGVVDGGISKTLAVMAFVAAFAVWCVLVLVGVRMRETWRASAAFYPARGSGHATGASGIDRNGGGRADGQTAVVASFAHALADQRSGVSGRSRSEHAATAAPGEEPAATDDAASTRS